MSNDAQYKKRSAEVEELCKQGLSDREIADRLGISKALARESRYYRGLFRSGRAIIPKLLKYGWYIEAIALFTQVPLEEVCRIHGRHTQKKSNVPVGALV